MHLVDVIVRLEMKPNEDAGAERRRVLTIAELATKRLAVEDRLGPWEKHYILAAIGALALGQLRVARGSLRVVASNDDDFSNHLMLPDRAAELEQIGVEDIVAPIAVLRAAWSKP